MRGKIVVEVNGVDMLQAPIGKDGEICVDKKYIDFIVNISNTKIEKNIKKNRPPESSGIYYLRVEKRKHTLQLRANWHRGKIYLEYGVNI